jgi:ribosomal protein RSM22 (predicted rRNA methylase)
MLSANSIRSARPRCRLHLSKITRPNISKCNKVTTLRAYTVYERRASFPPTAKSPAIRTFSTPRKTLHDTNSECASSLDNDIERVVRETKQRFRDTLPKGYLSEEEYSLYERLYGPPLRETEPEDVGIPLNSNQGQDSLDKTSQHALLRELEGGALEEVEYSLDPATHSPVEDVAQQELHSDTLVETDLQVSQDRNDRDGDYINAVARNRREYNALLKLQKDFEASTLMSNRKEDASALDETERSQDEEEVEEGEEDGNEIGWEDEGTIREPMEPGIREVVDSRLHPLTIEGQFKTQPSTLQLPKHTFVEPIADLLGRTNTRHLREAAEKVFGGPGLPYSPATPASKTNIPMQPIGLEAGHHRMSDIEADAFIAAFLPPAYAYATSILVEVRKRLGADWMRNLVRRGDEHGPRILDVGGAGACAAAWQDILQAEWDVMRENGEVIGREPPGKKTVVVGSEALRYRVSRFLHNTTFLPRLPDYMHSVDNSERHIDASRVPQPKKSYDIIIASHLLLPVKEGHQRKAVLNNLWSLLSPDGGILIVVEKGHPRGFEAVAEVRARLLEEFIIPPSGSASPRSELLQHPKQREPEPGMLLAPCTNHRQCPMYLTPGKSSGRKDFCHFTQRFTRPPFLQRILEASHRNHDDVQFSYVAVQRGGPLPDSLAQGDTAVQEALKGYEDVETMPSMLSLPRNILPPLKRRGHVTLDLCTPNGQIERWTIPRSFGDQAYHDARKAKWGDLWALGAKTRVRRPVRAGRSKLENDGGIRAARASEAGKKPRVFEIGYDQGGMKSATEKFGKGHPVERRTKGGRKPKQKDLLKELLGDS